MSNLLIERLKTGPILCDGAMGTGLFAAGHASDVCLELLNITHKEDVAAIHRAMIGAGAGIIETNTFGGNRYRLEAHDLEDKVRDINFRAAKIDREQRAGPGQ